MPTSRARPGQVQRLTQLAREHGVLFVEEPLPAQQMDGYLSLAGSSPVEFAAGEHLQGLSESLPLFYRRRLCRESLPQARQRAMELAGLHKTGIKNIRERLEAAMGAAKSLQELAQLALPI